MYAGMLDIQTSCVPMVTAFYCFSIVCNCILKIFPLLSYCSSCVIHYERESETFSENVPEARSSSFLLLRKFVRKISSSIISGLTLLFDVRNFDENSNTSSSIVSPYLHMALYILHLVLHFP